MDLQTALCGASVSKWKARQLAFPPGGRFLWQAHAQLRFGAFLCEKVFSGLEMRALE